MDRQIEKRLSERAVELGNSGQGETASELIGLLSSPSPQVRRLAASALGKLAGLADATAAVDALAGTVRDTHPQVRQYAIKALGAYGDHARAVLHDLRDIAANLTEKEYNRRAASLAIAVIEEAGRVAEAQAIRRCQRCGADVDANEYARSQTAFQRVFCDHCFDEVYLTRRNFDTRVELNKTIQTNGGQWVQSNGERAIADVLHRLGIAYRYDERIRLIEGYAVRPDFYLPEFDIYIEYWGMDTIDYKIGMLKKQKLYQQQGKRVISLYPEDKPQMESILRSKLSRYIRIQTPGATNRNEAPAE